jgi:predicted transcriptional regulator
VEDIMYRLYILQKIEAGEKDIAAGRTLSHKDVAERLLN